MRRAPLEPRRGGDRACRAPRLSPRSRLNTEDSAMPSVSVIVPVRNEARSVEHTPRVAAHAGFPAKQFEVIVADGRPPTRRCRHRPPAPGRVPEPQARVQPGPALVSAGGTPAMRHATKDVVVVVDGHCRVADRALPEEPRRRVRGERGRQPRPAAAARRPPTRRPSSGRSPSPAVSRLGHNPDSDIYSDAAEVRAAAEHGGRVHGATVFTGSGCSTRRSTPARTWSSTTGVHAAGLSATSRRRRRSSTSRGPRQAGSCTR